MNINPKYVEWYQEEITQPECIFLDGKLQSYVGTGDGEISIPLELSREEIEEYTLCKPGEANLHPYLEHIQLIPQKQIKVWKQRIKPEYEHLPLVDLLS
jgi:hypothetical protein